MLEKALIEAAKAAGVLETRVSDLESDLREILARLEALEDKRPSPGIVQASGLSERDILDAVNRAGPNDTVVLPVGIATHSNLVLPRPVHIRGQGKDGDNWLTVIRRKEGSDLTLWDARGDGYEIEGIHFIGTMKGRKARDRGLRLFGRESAVHHNRFEDFGGAGLSVGVPEDGTLNSGVAYENEFHNMPPDFGLGYGISVSGGDSRGSRKSWDKPVHPGDDTEAFVIEDNHFERCRRAYDGGRGARFHAHGNHIVWTAPKSAYAANHGPIRPEIFGCRWFEIANETARGGGEKHFAGFNIRGGDGLVTGCDMSDVSHFLSLNWQVISNRRFFTEAERKAAEFQKTKSLHIWDNKHNGDDVDKVHHVRGHGGQFKEGVHYFFEPRPGYVPAPYPHRLRKVA